MTKVKEGWERVSVNIPPETNNLISILTGHLTNNLPRHVIYGDNTKFSVLRDLINLGLMFAISEIANGEHPIQEPLEEKLYNESFCFLYHNLWINGLISEKDEEHFLSRCEKLMRAKQQDAKEKH